MKNKSFVIASLVGVAVLFGLIYLLSPRPSTVPQDSKPAFTMAPVYRSHNQTYGNPNAKVAVVEFLDPECEACRQLHPTMKRLIEEYGDRVKFIIRYMPLHGGSMYASVALEEARELDKFDAALDILFEQQPVWGDHGNPRPELVPGYLEKIGIPKDKLESDYLMNKHGAKIRQDHNDGKALGVKYTPTIFVNGTMLDEIRESAIRSAIEDALNETKND